MTAHPSSDMALRIHHEDTVIEDVKDERVIQMIKRYLKSGVMENGVVMEKEEGSPQGGKLPLGILVRNSNKDHKHGIDKRKTDTEWLLRFSHRRISQCTSTIEINVYRTVRTVV